MAYLATCVTPRPSSSHLAKVIAPLGGLNAGDIVACEKLAQSIPNNYEVYEAGLVTGANINSNRLAIVLNGGFETLMDGRRPNGQPDFTKYHFQYGEIVTVMFLDTHLSFVVGADSINYDNGEVPQVGEYLIPLQNSNKLGVASEFATVTALKIVGNYNLPIGGLYGGQFIQGYLCTVVMSEPNKAPVIAVGDKISQLFFDKRVTPDLSGFPVETGRVVLINAEDIAGVEMQLLYVEKFGTSVGLFFDGYAGTNGTLLYVAEDVQEGDITYKAGWQIKKDNVTFGATIVTNVNETEGWNGVYVAKVPFAQPQQFEVGETISRVYFNTSITPDLSIFNYTPDVDFGDMLTAGLVIVSNDKVQQDISAINPAEGVYAIISTSPYGDDTSETTFTVYYVSADIEYGGVSYTSGWQNFEQPVAIMEAPIIGIGEHADVWNGVIISPSPFNS